MTTADKRLDPSTLEDRLRDLDICVSEGANGLLTVYTTNEPLFCYDCKSEAEIGPLVSDTLKSYIETFYHVENVKVTAVKVDLPKPEIPVVEIKPVSKFKPSFAGFDDRLALAS